MSSLPPDSDPVLSRLERRVNRLTTRLRYLNLRAARWSWLRLLLFTVSCAVVGSFYLTGQTFFALLSALSGGAVFVWAISVSRLLKTARLRTSLMLEYLHQAYHRRLRNWSDLPVSSDLNVPVNHPFARDLDLLGPASLHQLCDTAVSYEGRQCLADWLLAPDLQQTHIRQDSVRQLRKLSVFRHALWVHSRELRLKFALGSEWRLSAVSECLAQGLAQAPSGRLVAVLCGLAGLHGGLQLAAMCALLPAWGAHLALTLYALVFWSQRRRTAGLLQTTFCLDHDVRRMGELLLWLENRAQQPLLRRLMCLEPLRSHSPAALMRRLRGLVSLASFQANPLAWVLINLLFPCDYWVAWRLHQIRPLLQARMPLWITAVAELEALCSLASLAWLHPEYTYPEQRATHPDLLVAEQLGHPLLPLSVRVRNTLTVSLGEVVLITGSNMAGKSTFLRALGLNLVLAQVGAPVDAALFQVAPLRLFCCIRLSDSLREGLSYFYAEIRRLRQLLEALEQPESPPLLWLIDEIFRGTNNRERYLGSLAFVEALYGRQGAGLLTTHDLELTRIERVPLRNFHFREQIEQGRMVFDYRLQPGPCPTTNALKIMALEGLPVPGPEYLRAETDSLPA